VSPKRVQALRCYIGSYNGLVELYRGNVAVATAHLWDEDTGGYNIPYVKRILPGVPCVIVHLACRMQGFYVAKGNPKNITTWEDLTRPDVLMINRERSCGVRVQFVPLQKERYDLIIKKDDINDPPVQAVLEILNSEEFKQELRGIGGYDISETGKIIEPMNDLS